MVIIEGEAKLEVGYSVYISAMTYVVAKNMKTWLMEFKMEVNDLRSQIFFLIFVYDHN